MTTSPNKVTFYIISITLILISALGYFFLYPTWTKIQTSKTDNETKNTQLESLKTQNITMKKLSEKEATVTQLSEKANNMIPKDPKLEDFLIELESLISQSKIPSANFQVTSLTVTNQVINNSLSVIKNSPNYQFYVEGSGTLQDILNLHNQLKGMQRLVEITSFTLNTSDDPTKLSFRFNCNIFSQNSAPETISLKNPNKILDDAISEFSNNKVYGKDIEIQKETGFGRSDPFSSY